MLGPFQHQELQRGTGPPEERGDGQRDLAQRITPEGEVAVPEDAQQRERVGSAARVAGPRVGDAQVEDCSQRIDADGDHHGSLGRGVDVGIDEGQVERQQPGRDMGRDEHAAQHGPQDDRRDGGSLDPAIGSHQLVGRQQLGQDAVLGRRIGRSTEAHQRVGHQRRQHAQQQDAAHQLDGVGQEHHAALGNGVGKGADEGGQHDVGDDEDQLQEGDQPVGRLCLAQQGDGSDQQRVVGQRRQELRCHDGVETGFHPDVSIPVSLYGHSVP